MAGGARKLEDEMSENLIETFEKYVEGCIDVEGVYPLPMVAIDADSKTTISAIALNGDKAIDEFMNQICFKSVKEIILGLDRSTRQGQGTEFADVLTCFYWKDRGDEKDIPEAEKNWCNWFKVGVINYQNEPRIVRKMDWSNEFWNEKLHAEIRALRPKFRTVIKKGKP